MITVKYQKDLEAVWAFMKPSGVPCFSLPLLEEIRDWDKRIEKGFDSLRYYVGGSLTPGVYSYGGDLSLFLHLINTEDRDDLREYAMLCLDCVWDRVTHFGKQNLTTISLVQGKAFGGGWESVLASDIIIAEERSRFAFLEDRFGLFPGMGAYSLLSRRIGPDNAQRVMTEKKIYSAQEAFDLGLVDLIVQTGYGERAVDDYIRSGTFYNRTMVDSRVGLDIVADRWVDTVISLPYKDLKVMERIARAQEKRYG